MCQWNSSDQRMPGEALDLTLYVGEDKRPQWLLSDALVYVRLCTRISSHLP